METWKPVVGYEQYYEVSDLGRVRSLDREWMHNNPLTGNKNIHKGKILAQTKRVGYLYTRICVENIRVSKRTHRLVAEAFIPNPENKAQVNHKNGVKTDNRLYNLEWCTGSENCIHSHATGLSKVVNRKKIMCVENKMVFESSYKAAEWLNNEKFNNTKKIKVLADKLRMVALGKRAIAYGHKWKYVD